MIPFGAAIAGDVLSAFSLPGGNTLALVASSIVANKRREAAKILIEEIRSGRHGPINFEEHDVEPFIDIILRFSKAVSEGTARENLILLAQVIAGLKKNKALDPDRFRRWSKVLEHLTRDELLVIGFAYRIVRQLGKPVEEVPDEFNKTLRETIVAAGYSDGEMEALLTTVASTGLLSSASAWGGLAFQPTPWLSELGQLADLERVSSRNC